MMVFVAGATILYTFQNFVFAGQETHVFVAPNHPAHFASTVLEKFLLISRQFRHMRIIFN